VSNFDGADAQRFIRSLVIEVRKEKFVVCADEIKHKKEEA
jgi:hypothetical protein